MDKNIKLDISDKAKKQVEELELVEKITSTYQEIERMFNCKDITNLAWLPDELITSLDPLIRQAMRLTKDIYFSTWPLDIDDDGEPTPAQVARDTLRMYLRNKLRSSDGYFYYGTPTLWKGWVMGWMCKWAAHQHPYPGEVREFEKVYYELIE